jgi:UDP-N-acetylmuramate dehydrogenase
MNLITPPNSPFLLKDILLSELTTWKIGGKTKVFEPTSIGQIQRFLNQYSGHLAVLGYGSNLLAPSEGFDGVCLLLKKNIPGSIGGAIVMNAGAQGQEILPFVHTLTMVDRKGHIYQFKRNDLLWQYRKTFLPIEGIVTSVTFDMRGDFPLSLKEIITQRSKTQPLRQPSCGSFFKNPSMKYPAGRLIQELGLKGFLYKGLRISTKHANFIINENDAQSDAVKELTSFVQKKVFLTTGLILETEYQLLSPLVFK